MTYNLSAHTGVSSGFAYKRLQGYITESELAKYCANLKGSYARHHTKIWSNEKHTEWLTRNYLAVKMMMSATVLLTSNEYAASRNLRIVEPYLLYYGCVCSCRALILTLPEKYWANDNLERMTHQKVINIAVDALNQVSGNLGAVSHSILQRARAYRELFSYRFPALGLQRLEKELPSFKEIIELCATIGELAQLHSECLQSSIKKHVVGDYQLEGDVIRACFAYRLLDKEIEDDDDYYRVGYWGRKDKWPVNLNETATDGMVEDYFGSWLPRSEDSGQYDPDKNFQLIFQFV